MNWLKRMVVKWVRDDWNQPYNKKASSTNALPIAIDDDGINMDNAIRFKVVKASGGMIVETHHYDRRTDRHNNRLHLIPDGTEDVSGAIGKIVFMEFLQQ